MRSITCMVRSTSTGWPRGRFVLRRIMRATGRTDRLPK